MINLESSYTLANLDNWNGVNTFQPASDITGFNCSWSSDSYQTCHSLPSSPPCSSLSPSSEMSSSFDEHSSRCCVYRDLNNDFRSTRDAAIVAADAEASHSYSFQNGGDSLWTQLSTSSANERTHRLRSDGERCPTDNCEWTQYGCYEWTGTGCCGFHGNYGCWTNPKWQAGELVEPWEPCFDRRWTETSDRCSVTVTQHSLLPEMNYETPIETGNTSSDRSSSSSGDFIANCFRFINAAGTAECCRTRGCPPTVPHLRLSQRRHLVTPPTCSR